MKPIHLKTSLFGFKRKQVLQYVNELCAEFQQQSAEETARHGEEVASLQADYENKLRTHEHAIAVQEETNRELEAQVTTLAASLDEKYLALKEEKKTTTALAEQLREKEQQITEMNNQLLFADQKQKAMDSQLSDSRNLLAKRDEVIARQAVEVTRLQNVVAELEEEFTVLRADAEQSTAMVNCLNLLQTRNRALSQKVARLEAQLEDSRTVGEIQEYAKSAGEKQETVKNTEQLFSAVRKEIQDALEAISNRIDEEFKVVPKEEPHFVDMARL